MPKSYKVELQDFTWQYALNLFDSDLDSMKKKMEASKGKEKTLFEYLIATATGYKQEILRQLKEQGYETAITEHVI